LLLPGAATAKQEASRTMLSHGGVQAGVLLVSFVVAAALFVLPAVAAHNNRPKRAIIELAKKLRPSSSSFSKDELRTIVEQYAHSGGDSAVYNRLKDVIARMPHQVSDVRSNSSPTQQHTIDQLVAAAAKDAQRIKTNNTTNPLRVLPNPRQEAHVMGHLALTDELTRPIEPAFAMKPTLKPKIASSPQITSRPRAIMDEVDSGKRLKQRSLSLPNNPTTSAETSSSRSNSFSATWDGEAEQRLLASMGYHPEKALLWSDRSPTTVFQEEGSNSRDTKKSKKRSSKKAKKGEKSSNTLKRTESEEHLLLPMPVLSEQQRQQMAAAVETKRQERKSNFARLLARRKEA